jgi:hypothetical protein
MLARNGFPLVEFKGKFYNIPASKIGPKPGIPIYLGGFSPNTFSRIIKYDLNGCSLKVIWILVCLICNISLPAHNTWKMPTYLEATSPC